MPDEAIYNKSQNQTYIYDENNKLKTIVNGDQSGAAQGNLDFQVRSAGSLKGSPGGRSAGKQLLKDTAVNIASQLPFAVAPEAGIIGKVAKPIASLLGGFGLDQALNSGKSAGSSASEALMNMIVGAGTSHLVENPPNLGGFDKAKGWGIKGIVGGMLKMLQGDPAITPVAEAQAVVRGAGGKWQSNRAAFEAYQEYLKHRSILNAVSNGLGVGANTALDIPIGQGDQTK